MKHPILTAIVMTALSLTGSAAHAQQWVDDWFVSYSSSSGGSYESQQRGYYALGSFQGRWRLSNDYLISTSPPRLKTGCGGIDMFGGAFSYLDSEYLVEKFERMVQAAPAFAFDLALQEFCKPCVAALHGFEEITNALNQIQINDCQLSKRTVYAVKDGGKALMEEMQQAASVRSIQDAFRKNWQAFQDATRASNYTPPDDTKTLTASCPELFQRVYTDGSVVANVTEFLGLGDYADIIRGLVGDAIVRPLATSYAVRSVDACDANDQLSAEDFVLGEFYIRGPGTDDICVPAGETRVVDVIDERLNDIADRMASSTALTPEDRAFINNSPIPIYGLLRDAAIGGVTENTIALVREPLAAAYAHRILDDLYKTSSLVLNKAREVEKNGAAGGVAGHCNTAFVQEAIDQIQNLADKTKQFRSLAQANYRKRNTEMIANLGLEQALYERRRKALGRVAGEMNQTN